MKENEKIELKVSLIQLKEGIISISAILNKHGKGKIIFGIKDDGKSIGVKTGKTTLRDISKSIADYIEPKIYPVIVEKKISNKNCVVISFEGKEKPYFAYGRAYIRTADENRVLSSKELEKLILSKKEIAWDHSYCQKAKLKDISDKKLQEYVSKARVKFTTKKQILENLGLIKGNKITNACVLLFGKEPQKFFRFLNLRCAVFSGKDTASSFIDMKDFNGDIFELINTSEKYILEHINIGATIKGMYRENIPEINKEAFREAIINAFCHRDYTKPHEINIAIFRDRLQIRNPGELLPGLTIRKITTQKVSERRNQLIADVLHRIQLIEKWGTGIQKIKLLESKAKFETFVGYFQTTFPRQEQVSFKPVEKTVEKTVEKIIILIKEKPTITQKEIQEKTGLTRRGVEYNLQKLKKEDKLKRIGPDKGGYWEVIN